MQTPQSKNNLKFSTACKRFPHILYIYQYQHCLLHHRHITSPVHVKKDRVQTPYPFHEQLMYAIINQKKHNLLYPDSTKTMCRILEQYSDHIASKTTNSEMFSFIMVDIIYNMMFDDGLWIIQIQYCYYAMFKMNRTNQRSSSHVLVNSVCRYIYSYSYVNPKSLRIKCASL